MVDDKFSCIKEVTKVVHISLPAACTSNEINGISDVLETWKRQYISQLQGVVVSYKNFSLTSSRGFIKLDYPFVLYDVKATFELFYPTVGSIVKGKINRISHDYIGCLVYNTVNATIDRSSDKPDISSSINLDCFILFEITRLDYKRKIVHVKGKITQKCIDLMKEYGLLDTSVNNTELIFNDIKEELSTDSGHHSPKKKKSKKSNSISIQNSSSPASTVQNSSLELENSTDTSSLSSSFKKKKQKKSKHDLLTSPSLFSESLKSEINEDEPMQPLVSTSKKKTKLKKGASISAGTDNDLMLCVKKEIHTDSSSSHVSPIKSPHKKKKIISNSPQKSIVPNSMLVENSLDISSLITSPAKIKKHKKSKDRLLKRKMNDIDLNSPPKKKHKKSDLSSRNSQNIDSSLNIKKEVSSDSPVISNKNYDFGDSNYVYELMEALSSFEPEEQSLGNEVSQSSIKKEPLHTTKTAKKRKYESSGVENLPKKKRKIEGENTSNKDKEKKHKKKKKKEKSKQDSKKEKKKRPKVISTKKKDGFKNNLKKKKKEKSEKSKTKKKKSVKQESKDVPSSSSVKSELN